MVPVIITSIFGLISDWFVGKRKIKEAKIDREVLALTSEEDWNVVQAESSKGSWKDEYWTLIFSIPLILCFFPDMVPHVQAGFEALNNTPDWYINCVLALVAASVGLRSILRFKK
ncbi:hypothetical protein PQC39_gp115 [Vibrio phage Vp_R1]|uniref:TMhelix containing protein n=1 Tax=Vibrio phage Vp_R1 TaxID=2059867 RepID=A0A2H5BQ64_9CAUD|nr:hypothetical protein PQC39_gp115 [Vibrio phage Vp_R1]AUG88479.1 hypothetical protein VPR_115 [Vibrio phage Vp_R1]